MNITKQLSFILMTLSSVYLCSCYDPNKNTPCPDTQYETHNLSAADLNKVPYTGFDTLYFLNKQGDTCIVRGTGKRFSYEIKTQNGNPACPPSDQYTNQLYTIQFIPIRGNLSFSLTQKYEPRRIYFDRGDFYLVRFDTESNRIGLEYPEWSNYIDSLTINKEKYGRIIVCHSEIKNRVQEYDTTYKLLYNMSHGVLFIKSDKDNEEFSIISKP
jgi:hypothetical protein